MLNYLLTTPESRKVDNLPPDKNIPEGKPSSQNNRKWAWLGCVIGASIVLHGPFAGQWPYDCNVSLTLDDTSIFPVVHASNSAAVDINHDLRLNTLWLTNEECPSTRTLASRQSR